MGNEGFSRRRRMIKPSIPASSGMTSHQLLNDGNVKISSEIVRNVAARLAKLSNHRVNKYGIPVALVFSSVEKKGTAMPKIINEPFSPKRRLTKKRLPWWRVALGIFSLLIKGPSFLSK
jgi:hypothetical protein